MFTKQGLGAFLAGGVLVGGFTLAMGVAHGTGNTTTYYACLKVGTLSHVGTTSPTSCAAKHIISWNSQGPQGLQGPQGPPGVTHDCSASPYPGIDLVDCNLVGDNFVSAPLDGANLTNSNLYTANMSAAQLYGASLVNVSLNTVNLPDAVLYLANLTGDDLRYSDLTNAKLMGGRIQAVSATSSANFSDGFIYPSVLRGRPLRLR